MNQDNIDPKLRNQLESLKQVPQRGLQASHASRENYLAQVESLQPRPLPQAKPGRGVRAIGRRSWVSRFAAIAAALLVLFSGLGGTVYAAQASQPDDLLYGVKTLSEEIQVYLENDPEDRLDLYVFFANRRLDEIQAQAAAGEEISPKALALLENHTQKMLQQAAQLGDQGLTNALRQIEQNLMLQNQVMTQLQKQTPGGGAPGLVQAQETIQSRMRLVENGINEPQGFQEQMRLEHNTGPGQGPGNGGQDPADGEADDPGQGNGPGPGSESGKGPGAK